MNGIPSFNQKAAQAFLSNTPATSPSENTLSQQAARNTGEQQSQKSNAPLLQYKLPAHLAQGLQTEKAAQTTSFYVAPAQAKQQGNETLTASQVYTLLSAFIKKSQGLTPIEQLHELGALVNYLKKWWKRLSGKEKKTLLEQLGKHSKEFPGLLGLLGFTCPPEEDEISL